ncbi:MAG: hypothetical protein Q9201_005103 [Fulgogasparrea decipioides]
MATPNPSTYKPAPTPRPPTATTVMTPASFPASSPVAPPSGGHRSYPSPAAAFSSTPSSTTKSQMNNKSPLNYLQQMQVLAAGGQAMSRSGTNTSSPGSAGNLGAFAGLNAMLMMGVGDGKTGLTPAGGLGTPLGVSPLPSHLGEGVSIPVNGSMKQQKRDQEEERRLRLDQVVSLLGQRWGYASREGLERCARRVGLDCQWEDEVPGAEDRTLSIAGNTVLLDVQFLGKGDEVGNVTLAFPEREDGDWGRNTTEGAEVFKKNLQAAEEERRGYVLLDPFVQNLERLARLDRLGTGGVNCFDAIEGLGGALRKLWDFELKKGKEQKAMEEVELDIMCGSSGKPTMHAEGRIGLALQYWTDRRHLSRRKRKRDDMDVDEPPEERKKATEQPTIWSLAIECEASSADAYPSIRVSDNWVSVSEMPIDQPAPDQQNPTTANSTIDWQEPPSAADTIDTSATTLDAAKAPDIRFVAHLQPPVLVPLQTALNIYASVGSPLPADSLQQPTTYISLLLPNFPSIASTSELTAERNIPVPTADGMDIKRHRYTLFSTSQQEIYAVNISSIPFSHPRQIILLLPVLRQWTLVSSLLRRCFDGSSKQETAPKESAEAGSDSEEEEDGANDLHALLNGGPEERQATAIDISLSLTTPSPLISLVFPYKDRLANVGFSIDLNGEIENLELRLGGASTGDGIDGERMRREDDGNKLREEERRKNMKRVLAVSEDLGVLVEWMER